MASPSQLVLPLKRRTPRPERRPVAVATRTSRDQPVRWGSALLNPVEHGQAACSEDLRVGPRSRRRVQRWSAEELIRVERGIRARNGAADPRTAQSERVAPAEGDTFAQSRIRHAFELFGACMLIAGFLAFAMFA